jgi:hypothetical protein
MTGAAMASTTEKDMSVVVGNEKAGKRNGYNSGGERIHCHAWQGLAEEESVSLNEESQLETHYCNRTARIPAGIGKFGEESAVRIVCCRIPELPQLGKQIRG